MICFSFCSGSVSSPFSVLFRGVAVAMFLLHAGALAQETSRLRIAPLGETVELELTTPTEDTYVLESHARVMEGEEWAPLMRFRGNAEKPRNWVDPICGGAEAKFFRLRRLLEAPRAEVSNFRLVSVTGKAFELYYQWPTRAIVVFLSGANLDHAIDAQAELDALRAAFGEDELLTWVVTVSDTDDRESLADQSASFPAELPVLQDLSHAVTRTLGSGTAPEAVLINPRDWSIAYRGPVSVQVDTGSAMVESRPLNDAVADLFEAREPAVSRMAAIGDPIELDAVPDASYSEHIAPLLQTSCFPCHTPGNIAPWAMTDYAVIRDFSGLIKSAVLAGEMPPWHADPKYSVFANSKALTKDEISRLVDWIDRGSPRGEGADPLVENPPPAPEDWPLGEPDAVVSIPTQSIPASGVVEYKYLVASSPFPNDVWLRGVSVKPGDRSVVHHCLVFKGSFSELIALQGGLAGFFAGYVPGMEQVAFPEGTGKRLKRTDIIVFQMHYTVSGTATTDRTQLGLYVSDAPPEKELVTSSAFDVGFTIPPNSKEVEVSAMRRFSRAATLYEFSPHMHYRGASAKYTLRYPDGSSRVILNVPAYFFDWQALYRLESPVEVPAGTVLVCEGTFDNSIQNRFNPDPNATVTFGEQSWEEMFIGYINFSE